MDGATREAVHVFLWSHDLEHKLARRVLITWLTLLAVYRSVLIATLSIEDVYDAGHYTYWNYTLSWTFHVLLLAGVVGGDVVWTRSLALYALPVVFGSVLTVFSVILVVLDLNDWLLLEETVIVGGATPIGRIHTGDVVVHTLPVIEVGGTLLLAFGTVLRAFVTRHVRRAAAPHAHEHSQSSQPGQCGRLSGTRRTTNVLYLIYWYVAPMSPLVLYSLFYNPFEVYPTGINAVAASAVTVAFCTFGSTFLLLSAFQPCLTGLTHRARAPDRSGARTRPLAQTAYGT